MHIPSTGDDVKKGHGMVALPDDGAPISIHVVACQHADGVVCVLGGAGDSNARGERPTASERGVGEPLVEVVGVIP